MANWAHAMTQGLATGLGSLSDGMQKQMDEQRKIDAERRAADQQLATHERLLAIQEAMRVRAAERFSKVVRAKSGEAVPMAAPAIDATGITPASAAESDNIRVNLRGENVAEAEKILRARIDSQNLPEADRQEARELLAQLERQKKTQGEINAKSVEGKTRARSLEEASAAALDETLATDPGAYMAGTGMLAAAGKSQLEKEKLASREKIEAERLEQREREARLRHEGLLQRLDALGQDGAKGSKDTALRQNVQLLQELGYSAGQIEQFIFDKKRVPVEDIAAKLMASDKFGEMTAEQAAAKAQAIMDAVDRRQGATPSASAASEKVLTWNPATGTFN